MQILNAKIYEIKTIIDTLNIAELRALEDYAQLKRIRLQDYNFNLLRGEE